MTKEGILLVDKPSGCLSFRLVTVTRRLLGVQKVGHAGTLDPLATGVMVLLVGKKYTQQAEKLIADDKEYRATVCLGAETDTCDADGKVTVRSAAVDFPDLAAIEMGLRRFQGWQDQVPPMFSAKKVQGKKLYELARRGIEIERAAVSVYMEIELLGYEPPFVHLDIRCSKGTYIRSLARDLGEMLGCYGHLSALQRRRSGCFGIEECLDGSLLCSGTLTADEVGAALRA